MKKEKNAAKQEQEKSPSTKTENPTVSYRLQCEKNGNGLSHYLMYGDEKNQLV